MDACDFSCEFGHCFTKAKAEQLNFICDKPDHTALTADGGEVVTLSRNTLLHLAGHPDAVMAPPKTADVLAPGTPGHAAPTGRTKGG